MLPLENEALTDQVKVKAVTGRQTQCRPDIGRDHDASLLAEHQCGIHVHMVPHKGRTCHVPEGWRSTGTHRKSGPADSPQDADLGLGTVVGAGPDLLADHGTDGGQTLGGLRRQGALMMGRPAAP